MDNKQKPTFKPRGFKGKLKKGRGFKKKLPKKPPQFPGISWGKENRDFSVDYSSLLANTEKNNPLAYERIYSFFMSHPVSYRKIVSFIFMKQTTDPRGKHTQITLDEVSLFSRIPKAKLPKVLCYLASKIGLVKSRENDEWRIPHQVWDNNNLLGNLKAAQIKEAQLGKKPFIKIPKKVLEERKLKQEIKLRANLEKKIAQGATGIKIPEGLGVRD